MFVREFLLMRDVSLCIFEDIHQEKLAFITFFPLFLRSQNHLATSMSDESEPTLSHVSRTLDLDADANPDNGSNTESVKECIDAFMTSTLSVLGSGKLLNRDLSVAVATPAVPVDAAPAPGDSTAKSPPKKKKRTSNFTHWTVDERLLLSQAWMHFVHSRLK